jgi:hypothetical protein
VNTLVLSQRFTDDSNLLWRAAIEAGWDVVRAHGFKIGPVEGTPVLYGETIFADAISEELGVSVVTPTHTWLPSLPSRFLQREVRLMTLAESLAGAFPAFIKPPDDKLFAARVYPDAASLAAVTQGFDDATPVLVSSPVSFAVEYRGFVANRRVAALSAYIRGGAVADGWEELPGEREGALALLEEIVADSSVELPPALVIDVGQLSSGSWAVVEANPAWASGLCGCDPTLILPVLAAATVPRGSEPRWARDAIWTHGDET